MGKRVAGSVGLLALSLSAAPCFAHAGGRGQIMLLPTQYYILGGGLAVLASALLVGFLPRRAGAPSAGLTVPLPRLPRALLALPSLASLALIVVLVAAGFTDAPDPHANPLPGFIWSLWWVGFSCLCVVCGNLWPVFNPWSGALAILRLSPPLKYPPRLGVWPAFAGFAAFAWFELVYPTPEDPARLASAVSLYLAVNFVGALLFGEEAWLAKAECFSAYFWLVGKLSPLRWEEQRVVLGAPGRGLVEVPQEPGSIAFVLLLLSSISFDGFSRTFLWIGFLGLNPLEFEGRSEVTLANTAGLLLMFIGVAALYAIAALREARALVMSLVPIAFAYHLAHYLPDFPVAAMRALKALSDPFGTGLDLLGTAKLAPPSSLMMDFATAVVIYRFQTAIVVIGHVWAVIVAHFTMAKGGFAVAEIRLNILMILYTMFGLWLLSAPAIS